MARGRSRNRQIDEVNWHGFVALSGTLSVGSVAINLISASLGSFTVMRTRGSLVCNIQGASAPVKLVQIAVGFWIVPEGTGTTVLASPISDPNADWFYYETFCVGYDEQVTDVIKSDIESYRSVIDSKAMRRSPSDTEVQCVFENATIDGADAAECTVVGRILLGN